MRIPNWSPTLEPFRGAFSNAVTAVLVKPRVANTRARRTCHLSAAQTGSLVNQFQRRHGFDFRDHEINRRPQIARRSRIKAVPEIWQDRFQISEVPDPDCRY